MRDERAVAAYGAPSAPTAEQRVDLSNLEPVTLACPRCHARVEQRLYGPCVNCVAELQEKYPGVARDVETDDYIPTMNVTPNAVATKD